MRRRVVLAVVFLAAFILLFRLILLAGEFDTVVTAARLKVLAALPPELRTRATRINERFHLDAPGWFQRGEELPHLATLAQAVWEARAVDMRWPLRVVIW